jgi:hypothetical protein
LEKFLFVKKEMKNFLFLTTIFIILFFSINGQISNKDLDSFNQILKGDKKTLEDVHYSLAISLKLNEKLEKFGLTDKLCSLIKNVQDPKSIYHIAAINSGLKCTNVDFSFFEKTIKSNIAKSMTIRDLFYSLKSIFWFRRQFKSLFQDKETLTLAYTIIKDRFQNGLFCSQSTESCVQETGYGFSALTILETLATRTNLLTNEIQNLLKTSVEGSLKVKFKP